MLVVAVSVLMPVQAVRADTQTYVKVINIEWTNKSPDKDFTGNYSASVSCSVQSDYPVYSYAFKIGSDGFDYGFVSRTGTVSANFSGNSKFTVSKNGNIIVRSDHGYGQTYRKYGDYNYVIGTFTTYSNHSDVLKYVSSNCDYIVTASSYDGCWNELLKVLSGGSSDSVVNGNSYKPKIQSYSDIGVLDNVQMETYVTNKKELIDADENADLSKINQDKVIVYSSTSTTGIDLSKGGYKVQLYGSYAWQDKSGNIKSEDKGHKTFIKDWNAENNIKGLNRSNYTWIDWKSANDKVESDKTDNAHKPNVFEKMTTYGNYQFEPIWYLRIVSKDNKYGAWVKLYNSTKKGKYTSEAVDDNDNSVSDSDGGYSKPKDTSEITGTGDTPDDAKNNVQKTEEKQDNKDIQDASGSSNSTFDKLEEFTKGIGDVPKMIADIFSFLPSWCLEVVAIGFALLMILIVVKFIRG
mgnify:CR=1 FL=1